MLKRRIIITLILFCCLLCCTAQAVTLRVSVADEKTGGALADASVYIDGTYVGSTASDGTYSYYHTGKKDLRVKVVRTGYKDWVEYVDADRTSVFVNMVRKDEILTFELYDAVTLKPIAGALVRIEGDGVSSSGTTGSTGSTEFSVKAGALYNVEVRTSGYYELTKTVQVENSKKVVQYWLFRSDLLAVQVKDSTTSTPIAGAEVFIDGTRAGTTDADGKLPLNLQREKRYSFRVTAPDYQTYQEERYLDADVVLLHVGLSKSTYPLSITATNEAMKFIEGAEVYLNGTFQGKTNHYGRFALSEVHAGTYEFLVRAPGYEEWAGTRQVSGKGEEIVAELKYDRASVTIRAEGADRRAVAGAVIVIDGQVAGTTDGLGCLRTALVTDRVYAVAAARDGYENLSVDVEIPLGSTEFTVPLVMEQSLNVWMIAAGIGVVAVVLVAGVLVLRRRQAGRDQSKPRGRDGL
ncbi:PEGA domain-containing protein [Methanoculleus sp. Wushi-C6]|uniref:PEGA domain-containing protein n=1 Tax=Methanoculleus caldifontis TaxID=2651577 RepID=A0ABU3X0G1_9EURY|nr:PEGA domain-containing protein [Methanoculleus sp. Wushi-C6]MDV2481530.1 PEGA domain-containing protein [Methanoculleus sp. Wushi-C6]